MQKFNTIGIEKWKCENMDLIRSENNNKVIAPPFFVVWEFDPKNKSNSNHCQ